MIIQQKQEQVIQECLAKAQGFVDTGDQGQFDKDEEVMGEIVRIIRNVASQWKVRVLLHCCDFCS
jgi:hypothetical protein